MFFITIFLIGFTLVTSRFGIIDIHSYTVVTGSMRPKLPIGSVVFTIPAKNYEVGNIITFRRGNISVTHRIVDIKNGRYVTKGDANNAADPQMVVKENIVGRDFLIIPYLGKFTNFLKTIPGFILFLGIPILLHVFLEAKIIKEEWEREIEKKVLQKHQINSPYEQAV